MINKFQQYPDKIFTQWSQRNLHVDINFNYELHYFAQ